MLSDDQLVEVLTDIKEGIGRLEGTLAATVDAHDKRFEAIEKLVDQNETRSWIISAGVVPVVTALHYLANKIGIRV